MNTPTDRLAAFVEVASEAKATLLATISGEEGGVLATLTVDDVRALLDEVRQLRLGARFNLGDGERDLRQHAAVCYHSKSRGARRERFLFELPVEALNDTDLGRRVCTHPDAPFSVLRSVAPYRQVGVDEPSEWVLVTDDGDWYVVPGKTIFVHCELADRGSMIR